MTARWRFAHDQMKTKFILYFTLAALCASKTFAAPFGTAFTYQGRLESDGVPFTGIVEFLPTLWDAPSGGSESGVNDPTSLLVPVTNGLFTATLDFGPAPFATSAALWLQLEVRTNMALNFTTLTPRQSLTPTPYAIRASSLSSGANQTFSGIVSFSPASGPPFFVNSTTKVSNLNADLLDGLESTAFVKRAGDTITGDLTVNSNLLVLGGFTGVANTNDASAVIGFNFNNGGIGVYGATDLLSPGGDVDSIAVCGATTHGTGIKGTSKERDGVVGLKGVTSKSRPNLGGMYAEDSAANGNGLIAVATNGSGAYALWGIAPQGKAAYLDGDVTITGDLGGVNHITVDSDSTIGAPHLSLHESQGTDYARLQLQAGNQNFWHIAAGGANNVINFYSPGNGNVMTLTTNGTLFVNVLTIRGGADLAEPFHINEANLPAGSVVVIDDGVTGQLRLSTRAYDTRVAGVVSGANGIKPGIMIQQEGVNAGGQNVALTGRVYAKTTAKNGAIQPGDLLTTADLPGYAMKVTEPARAQGAILGKAMSSLRQGEGQVLVLVTLQ
jgi:hypothetical protein